MIKERFKGEKFTIVHCKDALKSYREALSKVEKRRHSSFNRGMRMQIQRLADGHKMSKENFPSEGGLPKRKGQHNTKRFNAFKRKPVRGYCWLSETHEKTYFISHYVYKDYQELKKRDTKRVGDNWSRIEEKGDEC